MLGLLHPTCLGLGSNTRVLQLDVYTTDMFMYNIKSLEKATKVKVYELPALPAHSGGQARHSQALRHPSPFTHYFGTTQP
jgi:hypothetical protein